ncbi:MAG: class I SAM-dependent methyltransferase [Armatimonadetes bacterium]|nr:class I SAM-dependent methyltransferase [Armatimonadota bacterium]
MGNRDELERTRLAWAKLSDEFLEPGRRCWASPEIAWGIWNIPERELATLGDLSQWKDKEVIELGCGTGYFSAWMAKLGAKPTGIDLTPAQLDKARAFQVEFDLAFPLIEGDACSVPLPDQSFDLAISEYGASIWCDPYRWIPEAARLLRTGGQLVFLRNSPLSIICSEDNGPAQDKLVRDWFGMNRIEWSADEAVEYHLPHGPMIQLLRDSGFRIDGLKELQAPEGATTRHDYMTADWASRWPCEEIWITTKE